MKKMHLKNKADMQEDFIILVDKEDKPWGKLEKSLVHQLGLLHRAFSIFIFNTNGELLMQQRSSTKYHSGGLWTNTCCSHPRYGEDLLVAVKRRLQEEMGMQCKTDFAFSFIYKADFENGLVEHEYDHVFFGITDTIPHPSKSEVKNWKYVNLYALKDEILKTPQKYSVWLRICFENMVKHFEQYAIQRNLKIHLNASV